MLTYELQVEINRLYGVLNSYSASKQKAEKEQKELIRVIDKLSMKTREIEQGLQTTLETIDRRLRRVNPQSRFPEMYYETAKKTLYNSNSAKALQMTRDSIESAKKKCVEYDEKIHSLNVKINQTEAEIAQMKIKQAEAYNDE